MKSATFPPLPSLCVYLYNLGALERKHEPPPTAAGQVAEESGAAPRSLDVSETHESKTGITLEPPPACYTYASFLQVARLDFSFGFSQNSQARTTALKIDEQPPPAATTATAATTIAMGTCASAHKHKT